MSFQDDLAIGKQIELECLKLIRRHRPCAVIVDAYKGYDIWIPETHRSVEVKYDKKSLETGRWLIEVEMNNKPSGLSTSTADLWVFFNGVDWLVIDRTDLIMHLLTSDYKLETILGSGDKVTKKARFIHNSTMLDICKKFVI
jgi:hypothetical protein